MEFAEIKIYDIYIYMKNLILYGEYSSWDNFNNLSLQQFVDKDITVIKIYTLGELQYYFTINPNSEYFIIPITLNNARELNNINIKNLYPYNYIIDVFNNKKHFDDYVSNHNLTQYIPKKYTTYLDSYKHDTTTVIVKEGNENAFGYGVFLKRLCDLNQEILNNNIVQEYIYDNTEYAAHIVCDYGVIKKYNIFSRTYHTDNSTPFVQGNHCKYDYTLNTNLKIEQKHLDILEKFLLPCRYNGICCVDFKIQNDNVYLFEINPRVGASLASRLDKLYKLIKHLL